MSDESNSVERLDEVDGQRGARLQLQAVTFSPLEDISGVKLVSKCNHQPIGNAANRNLKRGEIGDGPRMQPSSDVVLKRGSMAGKVKV